MSTAPRYIPHYKVADYQQWEGDWELWDGVAVAMSPSLFGRHHAIAKNILFEFESEIRSLGCHASALYEIDWIVRDDTVVRPDIVVICGDVPERHVESTPTIVVEVLSEATRSRDTTSKRELYREQRVGYYVVVDPDNETITVDILEEGIGYATIEVADAVELQVCGDCKFELKRTDVFRR